MNRQEEIKAKIMGLVSEFYQEAHVKNEKFVEDVSRINYAGRLFNEDEMLNLVDSSLEFWLTSGRYVDQFEKDFAKFLGVKYVFSVNSGSSANLLAFMSLTSPSLKERAIKRGDEVITVAASFPTTVTPIVQYGAIPVFVDVELETCNIDCTQLEKAISNKTKAVMVAHTLGNPFDLSQVKAFCEKNNLWLIEDNCDALGSKYNDQFTGTFGDIATSSFYPPHHITMGEGGAVYTNNRELRKIVLSMRDWGRDCWCPSGKDNTCKKRFDQKFGLLPHGYDHKYVYSEFGYNLKITEMQASIGVAQLKKLGGFISKRFENFSKLHSHLVDLSDKLILPAATKGSKPSWFGFFMCLKSASSDQRKRMVEFLEAHNIQTRLLFGGNLLKQPCFHSLTENEDYRVIGDLKNTNFIADSGFWVGVYPGMTDEKLSYISKIIHEFFTLEDKK